jgi:hypothetical protein
VITREGEVYRLDVALEHPRDAVLETTLLRESLSLLVAVPGHRTPDLPHLALDGVNLLPVEEGTGGAVHLVHPHPLALLLVDALGAPLRQLEELWMNRHRDVAGVLLPHDAAGVSHLQ